MRQKADGAGSGEPVPCFPDADNLPRKLVMPQAELKPQAKHVQAKNPFYCVLLHFRKRNHHQKRNTRGGRETGERKSVMEV